MITAVFDCMVFLQAATNAQGSAYACLSLVEAGHVSLNASSPIIEEIRDVLTRPEIQARFPSLTIERVDLSVTGRFSGGCFRSAMVAARPEPTETDHRRLFGGRRCVDLRRHRSHHRVGDLSISKPSHQHDFQRHQRQQDESMPAQRLVRADTGVR